MTKKKKKKIKKNGKSNSNGKSEFGKRNKSLLGYNAIFTPEVIYNSQLYPQYKCTPVKDEGKITT